MGDGNRLISVILFSIALLIFSTTTFAQSCPNPGHCAGEIGGGTFNSTDGNFIFPSGVDVTADGTTFHVDNSNGRVGIATGSPGKTLTVGGDAHFTGNVSSDTDFCIIDGPCLGTLSTYGAGWSDDGSIVRLITIGDSVGIGTANPAYKLHVQDGTLVGNSSGSGGIISANTGVWGTGSEYGVYGTGSAAGVQGNYDSNNYGYLGSSLYGVYGAGTTWAGYFSGNATVTDSLFINNAITAFATYSIALSSGNASDKNIGGFFNGSNYGLVATIDKSEVESDDEGAAVTGASNIPPSTGDTTGALAYWEPSNNQWIAVYGKYDMGGDDVEAFLANGSVAVYGSQGDGDYAGYFDGNVTMTGNLTVGTGTIFFDSTNNKIGIGTSTPTEALTVVGTASATNFELSPDCTDGQILKWSGGVGTCGTDNTGTISISVKQNDSIVDSTVETLDFSDSVHVTSETSTEGRLELNVTGTGGGGAVYGCNNGYFIESIAEDGTVVCEYDNYGMSSWALYYDGSGPDYVYGSGVGVDFYEGTSASVVYSAAGNDLTIDVSGGMGGSGSSGYDARYDSAGTGLETSSISDSASGTAMYIDASGNVGLGDSTPSYPLDMTSSARASSFSDRDSTTYYINPSSTGTSALFAYGVGIGTTTPASDLSVGASGSSSARVSSSGAVYGEGSSYGVYASAGSVGTGKFGIQSSGTTLGGDGNGTIGIKGTGDDFGVMGETSSGRAMQAEGSTYGVRGFYGSTTSSFPRAYGGSSGWGVLGYLDADTWAALAYVSTTYSYGVTAATPTGYSGYFVGGPFGVRQNGVPTVATGAGDLYLEGVLENDYAYTYNITYLPQDVCITTAGEFGPCSSSRRFKQNITPFSTNFSRILDIEPKKFLRKNAIEDGWEVGYIAEEFEELGLEMLVNYLPEGLPAGIVFDSIIVYAVGAVKEQIEQIEAQDQKIAEREERIAQAEASITILEKELGLDSQT